MSHMEGIEIVRKRWPPARNAARHLRFEKLRLQSAPSNWNQTMQRIDVAIGILIRDGHVLICQRRSRDAFADLWEFPGGKCEPSETPEACLTRELREELTIEAVPGSAFPTIEHDYENLRVRLHPFLCEGFVGDPQPAASGQLKWVEPKALREFPFPAANAGLIEQIIPRLAQH